MHKMVSSGLVFLVAMIVQASATLAVEKFPDALREKLATAQPGDAVELPTGQFQLKEPLAVPAGVHLRGAGYLQTTLVV